MFKLWSETSSEALSILKPNLGLRTWNELSVVEKNQFWSYLEGYFFIYQNLKNRYERRYQNVLDDTVFSGNIMYGHIRKAIIRESIHNLNENYKYNSYAKRYLENKTDVFACFDFYDIFTNQDENVVLELLGYYCKELIKNSDKYFSFFSYRINDTFIQFSVNLELTSHGFIPRQGELINNVIYKPTLDFLTDSKFVEVNRDLGDAFGDYQNKDYSGSLTKTISAIQAFLQISLGKKIGDGEISELIRESIKSGLIPNDIFTETIFKNLKSILMRERQEKGDPHPKLEYANEQNARLILNISMVFIQHFIQLQK